MAMTEERAMAEHAAAGETGEPWTPLEIDVTVEAYVDMLEREVRGEVYTKADVVRGLMNLLPARSQASVERKLQNVSAIRSEQSWPWIDGYKPLPHYQRALRDAVVARSGPTARISEAIAEYSSVPLVAAQSRRYATSEVVVPTPRSDAKRKAGRTSVSLTGGPLNALADFQRRALGTAGEEWVLGLEKQELAMAGRTDLASQVRWVAREDGDGAGYDIRSYRSNGDEKLIEVKTTNYGPMTPFYITRWEIEVSEDHPTTYSLYRVHGFARDPRIYVLDGSISEVARLDPKVYLGLPL